MRDGALMTVGLNAEQRVVTGEPRVVADGVGIFRDTAFFAASRNALVYRGGTPEFQLALLDRRGTTKGLIGEPGALGGATLSPAGTRSVFSCGAQPPETPTSPSSSMAVGAQN
jgi:hypothetical protein